jgi:hypothetical protein
MTITRGVHGFFDPDVIARFDSGSHINAGVQLLARALLRVIAPAGLVTVSCNGMLGGAPGALLKRPSREAPAGNGTPVGPIRLPEL